MPGPRLEISTIKDILHQDRGSPHLHSRPQLGGKPHQRYSTPRYSSPHARPQQGGKPHQRHSALRWSSPHPHARPDAERRLPPIITHTHMTRMHRWMQANMYMHTLDMYTCMHTLTLTHCACWPVQVQRPVQTKKHRSQTQRKTSLPWR